ncbi:hypothetical protein [Amycolatopsis sp. Poz14]|uniref:hypothetical protein n=1 Tax=Amycolatopsis sp. Poz14 TaxID=1447705 RepID=UPI001EE8BE22|nr:hypothetical protein [Amycolatopsis sp. Poz14]MCG3757368.1 hypothetical protein [Amycolatopsis sp. Poz14]
MAVDFLPEIPGSQVRVEIAWGALMLDYNGFSWQWSDVTEDVLFDEGITTTSGRNDEASTSQPTSIKLKLDNRANRYSLGGISPNSPNVRRNVPVRVSIDLADGKGFRTVAQGYADGFSPEWRDGTGRIPIVSLSASGLLRRLLQGSDPLRSALYRWHTLAILYKPVEYWPLEEDKTASAGISETGGVPAWIVPLVSGGVSYGKSDWGGDTDNVATARAVKFSAGASLYCKVADPSKFPGGDSGIWAASWLMRYTSISGARVFIQTVGANRFGIALQFYTDGSVDVFVTQPGVSDVKWGTLSQGDFVYWDDVWHSWQITVDQTNPNTTWNIFRNGQLALTIQSPFLPRGVPSEIRFDSSPDPGHTEDPVTVGHVAIWDHDPIFGAEYAQAIYAYAGENAGLRMIRLGTEQGFNVNVVGTVGAQMGPQQPKSVVELLRECETADQGVLLDGLDAGLTYITRGERENAPVDLALTADQLYPPFEPTDDDQRNRNRVTASITGASSKYTHEDSTGPLGTAAIGVYDDSIDVNIHDLSLVRDYASWAVHLGTVEGYRYPSLAVNLRAAPALAGQILELRPSAHLTVANVADTIAGLPDDTVGVLVEGTEHVISPRSWIFTGRCSPAAPWNIATVADETGDTDPTVFRLRSDGSKLPLPSYVDGTVVFGTTQEPDITLSPAIPEAAAAGDTLLLFVAWSGTGSPATPAGWTLLSGPAPNMRLYSKTLGGGESAPSVAFTGMTTGAGLGARIGAFRHVGALQSWTDQANASTQDIAWPGVDRYEAPALLLALGWKAADWSGVQPVPGCVDIGQAATEGTPGFGFTWVYVVATDRGTGQVFPDSFKVNGGSPAVSRGAIVIFSAGDVPAGTTSLAVQSPGGIPPWTTRPDDYPLALDVGGLRVRATACTAPAPGPDQEQTFTVDPLPVSKPAGTAVDVWDPPVLGL